jgi:hypothetical protein
VNITDLYNLISPLVASGGSLVGVWIVTSRLRKRDALEAAMFRRAFEDTKDPCVLGYYAQMRSGRRWFTWPRRHPVRAPDIRRPPPSVP